MFATVRKLNPHGEHDSKILSMPPQDVGNGALNANGEPITASKALSENAVAFLKVEDDVLTITGIDSFMGEIHSTRLTLGEARHLRDLLNSSNLGD